MTTTARTAGRIRQLVASQVAGLTLAVLMLHRRRSAQAQTD